MNRLQPIYSFCLLLILAIGAVGTVNAQDASPTMITALSANVPKQDVYCDGTYRLINTDGINSQSGNLHLCPRVPVSGELNVTTVPANVVDWVLVELRTLVHGGTAGSSSVANADGDTVRARKPAFLLNNGRVVDAELYVALDAGNQDPSVCMGLDAHDNCPDVVFDEGDIASDLGTRDLYIVIRHRNHIDIMSSQSVPESSETGVYAYDFSSSIDQTLGRDLAVKSKAGVAAMVGGDADADDKIDLGDFNTQVFPNDGSAAYLYGDTNMDYNLDLGDFTGIIFVNDGRNSQLP